MIKAYESDGIYIPIKYVGPDEKRRVAKRYEKFFYKDKACENCDYLVERHCDICDSCDNFVTRVKLWGRRDINGRPFLRLPYGDTEGVEKIFGDTEFIQWNKEIPFSRPVKFLGKPWKFQVKAIQELVNARSGILKSAPRTGKCVSGDTLILTSHGLVPIKNMVPKQDGYHAANFKICTEKGWQDVVQTYRETVSSHSRIKTKSGLTLKGTADHPVLTLQRDMALRWTPLSEVTEGTPIAVSKWFSLPTFRSALIRPDNKYNKTMTPDLAAFMGYCVANGNLHARASQGNFSISSRNKRIRSHFGVLAQRLFPDVKVFEKVPVDSGRTPSIGLNSKSVVRYLEANGLKFVLSRDKVIPNSVIQAGKDCVHSFLEAYLSCDSYIPQKGEIQLCSSSKVLIKQLQFLLLSYGVFSAYVRSFSFARNGSRIVRPYYSLYIGARSKAAFLTAFTLKKAVVSSSCWRSGRGDKLPFAGTLLKSVIAKHKVKNKYEVFRVKNTQFKLSGTKKILSTRKSLGTSLTYGALARVNLKSLSLLDADLSRRLSIIKKSDMSFDEVTSVKVVEGDYKVYDVVVPETKSFLANGIVSHNTVMGAAMVCQQGLKTLILASQREWLDNFLETFIGSDTQPPMTDIRKSRIGIAKTLEEFQKFDVALATYQTFISDKGQRLLKKVRRLFSIVIIDEVQFSSATRFSQIVGAFKARQKIGLSGTPERKDEKHWVANKILGPVFYETSVERLTPRVVVTHSPLTYESKRAMWPTIVNKVELSPEKLRCLMKAAIADVKANHLVLIPLSRVKAIRVLVAAINREYGKDIAEAFYGGVNKKRRKEIIQEARQYKIKILVGQLRLLSTGINIPRASALYQCTPSSNMPKADQRFSRVLTPCEGKPQPIIRYFLDNVGAVRSCMRAEHFGVLLPVFRPLIDDRTRHELDAYFRNKPRGVSSSKVGKRL